MPSSVSFLLTHFDRLAEAPGGIAKLRTLIIDFAVRGNLVGQDAADESANELLKKTRAERVRLIKSGEMREGNDVPSVNEEPFLVPTHWKWVRLCDTGRIFNGVSVSESKKAELAKVPEGYPFIATKDVGYGLEAFDYENGLRVPRDAKDFKVAHKHAVLICAEGGSAGRKLGQADRDICFGNKLYANEVWPGIEPRYILFLYQSSFFFNEFRAKMKGIIGGIARRDFLLLPVPLPPSAEQRRIVAKVEELLNLCDALEAAQRERRAVRTRLRTSALHQLASPDSDSHSAAFALQHFSTISACPEDLAPLRASVLTIAAAGLLTSGAAHPQVMFAEVIEELRYGTSRKCAKQPSGTVVLRIPNVVGGEIDLTELKRTEIPEKELRDLALREGDLLIVRSNGSESLVGRVSVVSQNCEGFAYAGYLVRIRVARDRATPAFVQLALSTAAVRSQIEKPIRTTVGVKNINTTEINRLTFPLPPLPEQRRIVAKVDELMAVLDALEATLTAARTTAERLLAATIARLHAA